MEMELNVKKHIYAEMKFRKYRKYKFEIMEKLSVTVTNKFN